MKRVETHIAETFNEQKKLRNVSDQTLIMCGLLLLLRGRAPKPTIYAMAPDDAGVLEELHTRVAGAVTAAEEL